MTIEELEAEVKSLKKLLDTANDQLEDLEADCTVLFKTIKFWEKKTGHTVMKKGTYCGVEF